jgi:L-alanine-DL-glutamate epimerase-like enolase superfamily enzyme
MMVVNSTTGHDPNMKLPGNHLKQIHRRKFIQTAATIPLAVNVIGRTLSEENTDMKIRRIEIFPARYPMTGHFKFFTGPHGSLGRAAIFIKMTTENGLVGWGQSLPIAKWSYETLETGTIVLKDYFAPILIGHDATDIAGAYKLMSTAIADGATTGMPISRAGIDLAMHDLTGKAARQSLAQLWRRPQRDRLTLSWTLNPQTLDQVEPLIDAGRARGFKHFNIKVAPDPAFDVALAKAVRRYAPDTFLWADANGGYDPETALQVAPKLADAGVDILEAPIKPNRISGYQALKKQGALPILMDEGVITPTDLREFIRLKMIDGVAMKHSRCGGLLSCKEQIETIRSEGLMWVGSGLTDPDISLAAALGIYGAYGLDKPAALNGPQFLTADVLKQPFEVEDGTLKIPTASGLGIEVDETKVRELSKGVSHVVE